MQVLGTQVYICISKLPTDVALTWDSVPDLNKKATFFSAKQSGRQRNC